MTSPTSKGSAVSAALLELEDALSAISEMDLEELRDQWRCRWGAPPKLRSPELLRHMVGWRMQTESFGSFAPGFRRKLQAPGNTRPTGALTPGTRLVREWRGRPVEVVVTDAGFVHEGQTFTSLSEIARAVTGTRWSGPRFFGLAQERI